MGFQTYTCCICGKTGLTKRNTYFIEGKGRACRDHEQAKQANDVREEKRNTAQRKDFSRYCKLMKVMNDMNDMKNQPIYQMEHKDDRPEINLFLNFIEFSKCYEKYDICGSMSAIFDSDEYINSFHPNFDAALDRIKELSKLDYEMVESLIILDNEMNKALIKSNSQTD